MPSFAGYAETVRGMQPAIERVNRSQPVAAS
jgi:hypothetical protein